MKYAVIVYSIPLQDLGVEETPEALTEYAQDSLADLIADEGVQRDPVFMDEQGLDMLEAGLRSWAIRDTNETHKEA